MAMNEKTKPLFHCRLPSDKTARFKAELVKEGRIKESDFDTFLVDGIVFLTRGEIEEYNPDLDDEATVSFETLMMILTTEEC